MMSSQLRVVLLTFVSAEFFQVCDAEADLQRRMIAIAIKIMRT
jgi:hypothetical protein